MRSDCRKAGGGRWSVADGGCGMRCGVINGVLM